MSHDLQGQQNGSPCTAVCTLQPVVIRFVTFPGFCHPPF